MVTYLDRVVDQGNIVYLAALLIDQSEDANASNVVTANVYGNFKRLMLAHQGAHLTNAVTLAVLKDAALDSESDGSYTPYQDVVGTDLPFATTSAVMFNTPVAPAFRLISAGAEAHDETWLLFGIRD